MVYYLFLQKNLILKFKKIKMRFRDQLWISYKSSLRLYFSKYSATKNDTN